jgi:hypothetical protein
MIIKTTGFTWIISHFFHHFSWDKSSNNTQELHNNGVLLHNVPDEEFKQHLFQMKLFRIRMSLRERNYLSSEALFKSVEESSWYTMYANGNDESLVNVISLNRQSFEYLLQKRHFTLSNLVLEKVVDHIV